MADVNFDVAYAARLARLRLSNDETQVFQEQLAAILRHVDALSEADVSGVESASHAVPMFDVFREDESRAWFTAGDAMRNAPRQANQLFIVPKVVE